MRQNLRTQWLPALWWFYAERVRQLTTWGNREARAKHADGTRLSDDEVLAAAGAPHQSERNPVCSLLQPAALLHPACTRADFGIFIDLTAMCQKEAKEAGAEPTRTSVEDALFRHALSNLDIVYAHSNLASMLSTRLPPGVIIDRGYEERGWYRLAHPRTRACEHLPTASCVRMAAGAALSARWAS